MVDGNVSLSVLSKTLNEANKIDIENYLLLSSDLKGIVELPEIYFDKENPNRKKNIDILMMTQTSVKKCGRKTSMRSWKEFSMSEE